MTGTEKRQWHQNTLNGGSVVVVDKSKKKTLPPKKEKNSDLNAVNRFLGLRRRALYDPTGLTEEPKINLLTPRQRMILGAREAEAQKQADQAADQREAGRSGLVKEVFYLHQTVMIRDMFCGDCGKNLVRDAVIQTNGRGKNSGKTKLLINDYCSSCGGVTARQLWVLDSQIVRRE
ncbi:MAG: hypothetical protein V1810_00350 [Candidatus Beckwithbacteria bacterium]